MATLNTNDTTMNMHQDENKNTKAEDTIRTDDVDETHIDDTTLQGPPPDVRRKTKTDTQARKHDDLEGTFFFKDDPSIIDNLNFKLSKQPSRRTRLQCTILPVQ